ncbi:MAG: hypothetical protein IPK19_13630 [Chloroflexi bacterium]|nr:hypothetical protein [Chloroflexota bacterium]
MIIPPKPRTGVTFTVSDVSVGAAQYAERRAAELAQYRQWSESVRKSRPDAVELFYEMYCNSNDLIKLRALDKAEAWTCSDEEMGEAGKEFVVLPPHAFIATLHSAFTDHKPLILSPDHI